MKNQPNTGFVLTPNDLEQSENEAVTKGLKGPKQNWIYKTINKRFITEKANGIGEVEIYRFEPTIMGQPFAQWSETIKHAESDNIIQTIKEYLKSQGLNENEIKLLDQFGSQNLFSESDTILKLALPEDHRPYFTIQTSASIFRGDDGIIRVKATTDEITHLKMLPNGNGEKNILPGSIDIQHKLTEKGFELEFVHASNEFLRDAVMGTVPQEIEKPETFLKSAETEPEKYNTFKKELSSLKEISSYIKQLDYKHPALAKLQKECDVYQSNKHHHTVKTITDYVKTLKTKDIGKALGPIAEWTKDSTTKEFIKPTPAPEPTSLWGKLKKGASNLWKRAKHFLLGESAKANQLYLQSMVAATSEIKNSSNTSARTNNASMYAAIDANPTPKPNPVVDGQQPASGAADETRNRQAAAAVNNNTSTDENRDTYQPPVVLGAGMKR